MKYPPLVKHLEDILDLLKNGIIPVQEATIFVSFHSQLSNNLYLASLSIFRKHRTQSFLMLRQVLESSVLAAYSLENTNPDSFGKVGEQGFEIQENNFESSFFDSLEEKVFFVDLWMISNIAFCIGSFLHQVAQDYPLITFIATFSEQLRNVGKENARIKDELNKKNNPPRLHEI